MSRRSSREIWSYQPADWPEPHPAVMVSGPARVARKLELNIIICSSEEGSRPPLPNEVILDTANRCQTGSHY